MLNSRIQIHPDHSGRSARNGLVLGNWRALVALFTALTLVALLLTAATHHHTTAAEDHDCAICCVAVHKIADTHLVDLPKMVTVLIFYAPYIIESLVVTHVITLFLPPSCGPPKSPSAIC